MKVLAMVIGVGLGLCASVAGAQTVRMQSFDSCGRQFATSGRSGVLNNR